MSPIQKSTKRKAYQKKAVSKKLLLESDTDSDVDQSISYSDEEDDSNQNEPQEIVLESVENVKVDDFVIREFTTKTSKFYYVGRVVKERDSDDELEVDFYRYKGKRFLKPMVEDVSIVHIDAVKAILPPPMFKGTTQRTRNEIIFNVNFHNIDIR